MAFLDNFRWETPIPDPSIRAHPDGETRMEKVRPKLLKVPMFWKTAQKQYKTAEGEWLKDRREDPKSGFLNYRQKFADRIRECIMDNPPKTVYLREGNIDEEISGLPTEIGTIRAIVKNEILLHDGYKCTEGKTVEGKICPIEVASESDNLPPFKYWKVEVNTKVLERPDRLRKAKFWPEFDDESRRITQK